LAFGELPYGVPIAAGGSPATVVLNQTLAAEAPALLASYLVEATLWPAASSERSIGEEQAVAVAALGALAYGDFVAQNSGLADAATVATVVRNRELLALLNSGARDAANDGAEAGLLVAANGTADVLPGLYADPASFAAYVSDGPRATGIDRRLPFVETPLLTDYVVDAGLTAPAGRATLARLDAGFGALLSDDDALRVARALDLGVRAG
jgi:hypothetical protein